VNFWRTGGGGIDIRMNDILADAAQTIVLPMSEAGLNTLTFNPNLTNASIVEMGKQLLAASRDGLAEEVSSLLARSAPMTTDWLGTSPLHLAAINGHCSTAEVLMRSGCSRDARTKVDKTPLHQAATEGHPQMVELLIKSGAEVDSKDMLRMTPLHWAVERGHADSAEILIRYGADVNFENKFGKCPLELASEHGRSDIYEMLQNAEEIRASCPVEPVAHIDPSASDPITMAATQSIAAELGSPPTISMEDPDGPDITGGGGPDDAMKLLEAHGITLLPEDTGGTSNLMDTSAMNSGRQTLTLTEAGKLALSSSTPSSPTVSSPAVVVSAPPSFAPSAITVPSTSGGATVINKIAGTTSTIRTTVKPVANVLPSLNTTKFITINKAATGATIQTTPAPIQTTKSIVINTSQQQQQTQQDVAVKKAPRVIRVTPEQYAAIKARQGKVGVTAGGATRITGLGAATTSGASLSATSTTATTTPSNVITLNKPALAGSNIAKTVRLEPGATIKTISGSSLSTVTAAATGGGQKTIKFVRINPATGGATATTTVQPAITTSNVHIMPKPPAILNAATSSGVIKTTPAATVVTSTGVDKSSLIQKQLKEIKDAREALMRKEEELVRQLGPS